MKKISKKGLCLILGVIIVIALILAMFLIVLNSNKESDKQAVAQYDHYLQLSPSIIYGGEAPITAYNNDLIYYYSEINNSIVEYDLTNSTATEIYIQTTENNNYSCFNMYGGVLYALEEEYNESSNSFGYSIVTIDYNDGNVSKVYSTGDYKTVIGCLNMSSDGLLYFIEGEYDENKNDKNGYNESYALYKLDLQTNEKTELTKANTFYIDSDVIYYTKLVPSKDCLRLFYAPTDNTENETDTGVDVCSSVSAGTPYMIYPHNGRVYYAPNTNRLFCYDPETNESETVAAFSDESYVRFFQYFGDDLLILVREPYEKESSYQFGLYYLRDGQEPQRITGDDEFNEDYYYSYEWINYLSVFNECSDYFLLATYNEDIAANVYIFDKDYTMTNIISDGEWNYKAFFLEKEGIDESQNDIE
ncbi:MAG: hypothetical protein LUI06_08805 [Ruminococcus sp.]|nr:hypothetical protein [Ruminococcus sp.]